MKNKENMKKYLSFGGGVNSVAMMLLMLDLKEDFEAIFEELEEDEVVNESDYRKIHQLIHPNVLRSERIRGL